MKYFAACLLALSLTSCEAQTSHVGIAYGLYTGCMTGFIQSKYLPDTVEGIDDMVDDMDQDCVRWALVWYPTMLNDEHPEPLRNDELDRIDRLRTSFVTNMIEDLEAQLKKIKK
jgi:hypothetical protein